MKRLEIPLAVVSAGYDLPEVSTLYALADQLNPWRLSVAARHAGASEPES